MYSFEEIKEMVEKANAERNQGRVAMANYYLSLANTMIEFNRMTSFHVIEAALVEIGYYLKEKV